MLCFRTKSTHHRHSGMHTHWVYIAIRASYRPSERIERFWFSCSDRERDTMLLIQRWPVPSGITDRWLVPFSETLGLDPGVERQDKTTVFGIEQFSGWNYGIWSSVEQQQVLEWSDFWSEKKKSPISARHWLINIYLFTYHQRLTNWMNLND